MKKIACLAVCFTLLFLLCVQAEEKKKEIPYIELKGHQGYVISADFSPDGKKTVTASYDGTARIWDAETGKEIHRLKGHTSWASWWMGETNDINSAAFSADGKKIVTAGDDGTARIWDAETGQQLKKLEQYMDWVLTAAFSPDGKKVVVTGHDKDALVFDADSGQLIKILSGHANGVCSAVFSPDGKTILTGGHDRTVRIWNSDTGDELRQLGEEIDAKSKNSYFAAFSPDGKKVVITGDDESLILDAESGAVLKILIGHTNRVCSAAFSRDGKKIVTASYDNTAKIWETATGKELQTLEGHIDWVRAAAFSPDGKKVITVSDDETARIWDWEL